MKGFLLCLLIFEVIYSNQVLSALTSAEQSLGKSMLSKLDSFMRPKSSSVPKYMMSLSGYRYRHKPAVRYVDFMLLFDSSGSIGFKGFKDVKDASEVIIDYINNKARISSTGSRVGLIRFSSKEKTRKIFSFNTYKSARTVKRAIDKVEYVGGWTATALGLKMAKEEFNRNDGGNNAQLIWALTDGKSNREGDPVKQAEEIRGTGVTICVVAIGDDVNMDEINGMASPECVFRISSFAKYKQVMSYAYSQSDAASNSPKVDANWFKGIEFRK